MGFSINTKESYKTLYKTINGTTTSFTTTLALGVLEKTSEFDTGTLIDIDMNKFNVKNKDGFLSNCDVNINPFSNTETKFYKVTLSDIPINTTNESRTGSITLSYNNSNEVVLELKQNGGTITLYIKNSKYDLIKYYYKSFINIQLKNGNNLRTAYTSRNGNNIYSGEWFQLDSGNPPLYMEEIYINKPVDNPINGIIIVNNPINSANILISKHDITSGEEYEKYQVINEEDFPTTINQTISKMYTNYLNFLIIYIFNGENTIKDFSIFKFDNGFINPSLLSMDNFFVENGNCFIKDTNTYPVCSNVINQIYNKFYDFDNYNYKNTDKQLLKDIENISVESNDIIVNLICEPNLSITTSTLAEIPASITSNIHCKIKLTYIYDYNSQKYKLSAETSYPITSTDIFKVLIAENMTLDLTLAEVIRNNKPGYTFFLSLNIIDIEFNNQEILKSYSKCEHITN